MFLVEMLTFLFIFVLGISAVIEAKPTEDGCHPTPKILENFYLVGYGSLISSISKNNTSPDTGANIPVTIHGYARKFNCKGSPVGLSTTFLGVDEHPSSRFNGVVFKLTDYESLKGFDKRESYYCRQEVKVSDIDFLTDEGIGSDNGTAQYWIYVVKPEFVAWPSKNYPIVQSYVDVFLSGCLEMEKNFGLTNYSDDCMTSTEGWSYPWVNDRIQPRRPWLHEPKANSIDNLLHKHLPSHFQTVVIEQEIWRNQKNGARIGISLSFVQLILIVFVVNYTHY